MEGASRAALAQMNAKLHENLGAGGDPAQVAQELLGVVDVLDSSASLRRALADPSREAGDRAGLVDRLFGGKIGDGPIYLVREAVAQRWSSDRDLVDALERLGVSAQFVAAERRGRLDQVEEELFRFERAVSGNPELRDALLDRQRSGEDKAGLVDQLLSGKSVEPETRYLLDRAARHPRGRRYERSLEVFGGLAAAVRDQLTALVTVAAPLDEPHRQRLTAALANIYGRPVTTNIVVDPRVVGGMRVQVGDDVIDGTISSRLDQVRRDMTS